jgi:hypothetical protein
MKTFDAAMTSLPFCPRCSATWRDSDPECWNCGWSLPKINADAVLKVSLLTSGTLFADGTEITLAELDGRLATIHRQNGIVWYFRENMEGEAPAIVTEVLSLIVKHKLPISLSTKPDFSDAIWEDGVARPRR